MRHCEGLTNILCLLFFFFLSEAENSFRSNNQIPKPNSSPPKSLVLNCNTFASAEESCFSGMRELGDRYISSHSMKPQDYTSPTPPASSHILSKSQLPSKQTAPATPGAAHKKFHCYKVLSHVIDKQRPSKCHHFSLVLGPRCSVSPFPLMLLCRPKVLTSINELFFERSRGFQAATLCLFGETFSLGKKGAGGTGGSFGASLHNIRCKA